MPGLSIEIVEHKLPMKLECQPIQQKTQENENRDAPKDKIRN